MPFKLTILFQNKKLQENTSPCANNNDCLFLSGAKQNILGYVEVSHDILKFSLIIILGEETAPVASATSNDCSLFRWIFLLLGPSRSGK
jgi:hypothetical protein